MGEIFLTSDTHFFHNKPFLYEPRGFSSIEEMNEAIVERWNEIVRPEDKVWHLGDIALNDTENAIKYINRLNGEIMWIGGNHDSHNRIQLILRECSKIYWIGWASLIKIGKISCYFSHYPTLTANYDKKHFSQHVINFHGHTHSKEKWEFDTPFTYNVGMDAHNCYPIPIDLAIEDIKNKYLTFS